MAEKSSERIDEMNDEKQPSAASFSSPSSSPALPQLQTRNFWLWQLLTLITGGIAGYVYLFLNLVDLNRLDNYPRLEGVPSTRVNVTYLIFCLLCLPMLPLTMLYIFYLKFELLSRYLSAYRQQEQEKPKLMRGRTLLFLNLLVFVLGVWASFASHYFSTKWLGHPPIMYVILALSYAGLLLAFIYSFMQSFKWQKLMNEQVLLLAPNALRKKL